MSKPIIRQSIFRVLSDLIKSDDLISLDELDGLDELCNKFGITYEDKIAGYAMTLGGAITNIARQNERMRRKVADSMRFIAMKDSECCRAEALLVAAMEYICTDSSARIVSLGLRNRPLLKTQLLYVESKKKTSARSDLDDDKKYEELRRIMKMGGLELVYIPKVAKHFKSYGTKENDKGFQNLKKLLRLVSPLTSEIDITYAIYSLQDMDSRFFYNHVLLEKLHMDLRVDKPAWVIRLPDSIVNGVGYANYFCFDVNDDISKQLIDFVDLLNKNQTPYSITVNDGSEKSNTFRYNGFYKALLEVMSVKKSDKWDIHIRLYGEGGVEKFQYFDEKSNQTKKCIMTIRKGIEEYPIPITGRDVAFYLLLLCASASEEKGVDFLDLEKKSITEKRYVDIFQRVSSRQTDRPWVWLPESRIPMKSRVSAAINDSAIAKQSSLQSIYLPEETRRGFLRIPLEPERVFIENRFGAMPLIESELYQHFLIITNND